jgi:opacity protein-like surface antigen
MKKNYNFKKILNTVVAVALISTTSYSQKGGSGNCVQQGTILVDAIYGFPYINGTLIKVAYSNDSLGGQTTPHNYNHFGGKVEYMVSDNIGLGVEGTYAIATVDYRGNDLKYYTAGINKLRILAKFNYHFATTAHLDPYFTAGAGYKNTKVYTNEPTTVKSVSISLIPVSIRVGVGIRYFFTDFMGVNAEVGLGGPIMEAGLSFKF